MRAVGFGFLIKATTVANIKMVQIKNVYKDGHIREDKVDTEFSLNDVLNTAISLLIPSDNVAAIIVSLIQEIIIIAFIIPLL